MQIVYPRLAMLILALMGVVRAHAQTEAGITAAATDAGDAGVAFTTGDPQPREGEPFFPKPTLTGEAMADFQYFPQTNFLDPNDPFLFGAQVELRVTGAIGTVGQYYVSPRLQITQDGLVREQVELLEQDEARSLFTLREAFVEFYPGDFELSAGKRVYTWGTGDAVKPTDVINPRDYLVLADDEKIGVPSVSIIYNSEYLTATGVVVPWFSPSRIPEFDNRWFPDPTPTIQQYRAVAGFDPTIVFPARQIPGKSTENIQGGGQLASSTLVPGWDLALNYYRGIIHSGTYVATSVFPTLDFTLFYPPYHMGGGSFSTTWGDFEFHGEAAHFDIDDNSLYDDYVSYVAGTNYTWMPDQADILEKLMVILEYAGEQVTERLDNPLAGDSGVSRAFTNSVAGRVRFEFLEETVLEIDASYNFEGPDAYWGGEVTHKFTDRLEGRVGADVYFGFPGTFFGSWARNDRVYTRLVWTF